MHRTGVRAQAQVQVTISSLVHGWLYLLGVSVCLSVLYAEHSELTSHLSEAIADD